MQLVTHFADKAVYTYKLLKLMNNRFVAYKDFCCCVYYKCQNMRMLHTGHCLWPKLVAMASCALHCCASTTALQACRSCTHVLLHHSMSPAHSNLHSMSTEHSSQEMCVAVASLQTNCKSTVLQITACKVEPQSIAQLHQQASQASHPYAMQVVSH